MKTTRYTAGALALGFAMLTGCTGDPSTTPADLTAGGVTGTGDPVVTGNGEPSDEPASIQFHFDPVATEDGRVFDTLSLIPEYGGSATWDEAAFDPDDPSTYPPAGFAFAVEIRDVLGELILESEPDRLLYPTDFGASGADPIRPWAHQTWTFYPADGGDAVEICPDAPGAGEWLEQVEGLIEQVAATAWEPVVDEEPAPIDPPVLDNPPTTDTDLSVTHAETTPAPRMAGGDVPNIGLRPVRAAPSTADIPDIDDSWAEILFACWGVFNEVVHWYEMYEEKCFAGNPKKFDITLPHCWAKISGLLQHSIEAGACAYVMADKLGLVPTDEGMRKLARALLVSYALSGQPKDLPKLPPPPAIVKPKDK